MENKSKPKITFKSDPLDIRIYVNDILFIYLNKAIVTGLQSWIVTKNDYKIEIYQETGDILFEFNNFYKWSEVLKILDENL